MFVISFAFKSLPILIRHDDHNASDRKKKRGQYKIVILELWEEKKRKRISLGKPVPNGYGVLVGLRIKQAGFTVSQKKVLEG